MQGGIATATFERDPILVTSFAACSQVMSAGSNARGPREEALRIVQIGPEITEICAGAIGAALTRVDGRVSLNTATLRDRSRWPLRHQW